MKKSIIIAVDAMGGDDSPSKIIKGIDLFHNNNKHVFYKIFGNQNLIIPLIETYEVSKDRIEIIHTDKVVEGEDSALTAAKKGKETSLWLAVESLKININNKPVDIKIPISFAILTKIHSF